jgi:hypothetical protein
MLIDISGQAVARQHAGEKAVAIRGRQAEVRTLYDEIERRVPHRLAQLQFALDAHRSERDSGAARSSEHGGLHGFTLVRALGRERKTPALAANGVHAVRAQNETAYRAGAVQMQLPVGDFASERDRPERANEQSAPAAVR